MSSYTGGFRGLAEVVTSLQMKILEFLEKISIMLYIISRSPLFNIFAPAEFES